MEIQHPYMNVYMQTYMYISEIGGGGGGGGRSTCTWPCLFWRCGIRTLRMHVGDIGVAAHVLCVGILITLEIQSMYIVHVL